MLYWWNFSVFLSILKAFLVMPKRLLMSLCSFPSRLSVLLRYVNLSVVERSFPFALISVHCHHLRLLFVDLRTDLFNKALTHADGCEIAARGHHQKGVLMLILSPHSIVVEALNETDSLILLRDTEHV